MARLLLLCLLLAAWPAAALERVRLQLNWKHQFQFAGYYAAIEKGYYREAGLEVEPVEAETGKDPIDGVLGGDSQYGIGASELVLRRGRGEPVVALAAILQHSPLVLLARQAAGIDSIHDLAGRRVMLMPHETELYAYLRREGIAPSSLQALHHSFDTADLIEGRVDAISGYATDETFVLRQAKLAFLTFTPRASGIDFYGDTLFTTEAQLRQRPGQVKAFRDASLRGWRYAMAHREEIVDLILAKYSHRHSRDHLLFEAAEMARLMQPDLVDIGHMTPGRWRHMADTYAELDMLAPGVSLDGFLYEPQPAALPAWILPTFVAGGLIFAAMALAALRFAALSRRLRGEMDERQAADRRLRSLQRDMMALIDATPGAAMLFDQEGRILAINQAGATRFEGDKHQITGRNIYELSTPALADRRRQAVAQAVAERRTLTMEDRRAGRNLRNTIVPVEDEDGEIRRIAVFSEDITERKRAEDALRASEERYRFLAENTADVVWQVDEHLRIVYINAADERLRGFPRQQVIGRLVADFLTPAGIETVQQVMAERARREAAGTATGAMRFEVEQKCADGGTVWVEIHSTPLRNVDGQVVGYNGISRDMSQRRAEELALRATHEQLQKQFDEIQLLQAKLAEQAIHDSLTGLYNRRYLDETLERELARARREGYPLSLVMIDLDLFKRINDDHGHKAGDEVLRALARLLHEDVRAEDVPCRYGGEEFLVLLPKMPPVTAAQRAEGWRRAIEGMAVPFGGEVLRITASFGVAAYPEHGVTPDDLTQRADEALYQAKAAGRNRVIALGGGQPPSGETP